MIVCSALARGHGHPLALEHYSPRWARRRFTQGGMAGLHDALRMLTNALLGGLSVRPSSILVLQLNRGSAVVVDGGAPLQLALFYAPHLTVLLPADSPRGALARPLARLAQHPHPWGRLVVAAPQR